ncbi:MAG: replication-associated recombination protein A [Ruminococcaceae bacterium]|nr:replication-associated recombination protein A [Oscillospiraceae bacterium]
MKPLADRIRPKSIDEVFGQEHLIGEGKIIRNIIETKKIPNMIFYGPPGTGKTTIANILADVSNKKLYKLNATNASVSDIKDIIGDLGGFDAMGGVLLYLDEIQNFNKKQQQSLLSFIEDGSITLIASTTENPYFYVYNAILSRSSVFEFKPLSVSDIKKAVDRAVKILNEENNVSFSQDAINHIAEVCGGDVRSAINMVELLTFSKRDESEITLSEVEDAIFKKSLKFDKSDDNHYDILSAFQKSIRGSDENAALHYLARLIEGGDIKSAIRRLLVIASEDIGLAYPQAASIVNSLCNSALMLGLPEARIPLAEAVILLATSPKSNSVICAIDDAISDIKNKDCGDIPLNLKDAHYQGASKLGRGLTYKYPHSFENNYVSQQYLPDNIKNAKYYQPGNNKMEKATEEYWKKIKGEC